MTSNVLPLFWNLASSSRDTRLSASVNLVSSLQGFQTSYQTTREDASSADEDEEEDDESGMEVDDDDEDMSDGERKDEQDEHDIKLDRKLAKENAVDVVYCLKRLIRGLGSSRESSRLGFAVALTELLNRIDTITTPQVLSLLLRNSRYPIGLKGAEARDLLFARLFGLTALINSHKLFTPSSTLADFDSVLDQLLEIGEVKGWLRESAWWAITSVVGALLDGEVSWKEEGLKSVLEKTFGGEKVWGAEKVALALVLERARPNLDWKTLLAPTFKHTPLLASGNLITLGRLLKESDAPDDEDEGATTSSTGSWKPQLHFVWNTIVENYFPKDGLATAQQGQAPFQDFFRVVVDESLFSNTSSSERKYWGFTFISQILPLLPPKSTPQIFTPNFMRCWTNNLSSSDRYLHKAALGVAKLVQDVVKANPTTGFALLSTLVGKNGRMDFDKVTKTKTVEGIIGGLSGEGVEEYVQYLQGVILANEDQNGLDTATLEERRSWALSQLVALCRNTSVPKADAWLSSTIDFLLVHGFFIIRKVDKKSTISALHSVPKPALSESTAATVRARFFSSLIEITTASTVTRDSTAPVRKQGCDSTGKLWLQRALDTLKTLEENKKHVEVVMEADEEIVKTRQNALTTMASLSKATPEQADLAKGVEILLAFTLLQTYDESEDALEMLEEVSSAAERIFTLSSAKASSSATAGAEDDASPVDGLLDVLIGFLDKASSDLRSLATLVFGMISPSFTSSSIQHLVAQLEQSAASAAAAQEDEEDDEDEDDADEDDAVSLKSDESSDAESEVEEDDDDTEAVDPAFRQRVAEALQVSGMNVNGDVDSDEESEVWDDERMMQVDEQLAAVFRQRGNPTTKRSDLKNLQIESLHFRNRILDFFDVFVRKQSSNSLVLDLILPLLRLIRSSGPSETDLSSKATSILKSRLGKAKDFPTPSSSPNAGEIMTSIHEMARRSPTADFCALCSICSLFVSRACDDEVVLGAYRASLNDFMGRKSSLLHPPFIVDLLRRFPLRAWGLQEDLIKVITPGTVVVNTYRLLQGYTMIQVIGQQLAVITKAVGDEPVVAFVIALRTQIYATLDLATTTEKEVEERWTGPRLKEIIKVALSLTRSSKNALGAEVAIAAWDAEELTEVVKRFKEGTRTGEMKGVIGLLVQLEAVLRKTQDGKNSKKKSGKGAEPVAGEGEVKKDVGVTKVKKVKSGEKAKKGKANDEKAVKVDQVQTISKSNGDAPAKKEKKRKSIDGAGVEKVEKAEGEKPKKAKKAKVSVPPSSSA